MTAALPALAPAGRYELLGAGIHSWVFHLPGSSVVVQHFRPDAPELTIAKVEREYAYLRAVFDPVLPELIPPQELWLPGPHTRLCEAVLVKQFVQVCPAWNLRAVPTGELPASARAELAVFLARVRDLLTDTSADERLGVEASLIPDFIDPPMDNLVVDTTGRLRLIDTNRLISTLELRRQQQQGRLLDGGRDDVPAQIYRLVLRRLLWLEHKFLGTPAAALAEDALVARYLPASEIPALFAASATAGEPIDR